MRGVDTGTSVRCRWPLPFSRWLPVAQPVGIVSMYRNEIIGGTMTKESTTTSGLSRIIAMAATIADSTAISKRHIGSGATITTPSGRDHDQLPRPP